MHHPSGLTARKTLLRGHRPRWRARRGRAVEAVGGSHGPDCVQRGHMQRDSFLQSAGSLMPGYTGHCPTLKFKIGKRYGANTREIIKEMGEKGMWARRLLESRYKFADPLKEVLAAGGGARPGPVKCGRYILGYTGFIPGMNFSYGKSYARLSEENYDKFHIKRKTALEHVVESKRQLRPDTYKEEHISATRPPIAGYTGHIPRLRSSDTSLSRRYHEAAKAGLLYLQKDREKLRTVEGIRHVPHQMQAY